MSIELGIIKNKGAKGSMGGDLNITQFYGGRSNGIMIQLTQGSGGFMDGDEPGFIQLTIRGACNLNKELKKWIKHREKINNEDKNEREGRELTEEK